MTKRQFENLVDLLGVDEKKLSNLLGIDYRDITDWHEQCSYPSWFREWALGRICIKRYNASLLASGNDKQN